jgi:phosphoglycerol transferase
MFFIFSTSLTIISLILTQALHQKGVRATCLLLILINLISLGFYLFLDFLSGDGINDAVLYHFYFGITGFGIHDYIAPIILLATYIFICFLLISTFYIKDFKSKNFILSFYHALPIFLISSLALNPFFQDLHKLYFKSGTDNLKVEASNQNFFVRANDHTFLNKKKNIIYLYLEQFERTYFDESIFPGLTPNLKRLEAEAVSFLNIHSPQSTNWTIAGMVASQCGIPLLVPNYRGNSMSGMDLFLPLANCLGDILTKHQYDLNYLGGSNLDFGGKGKFYYSHGFKTVEGLQTLHKNASNSSLSPWGLYDDDLYKVLTERYNKLNGNENPFGIFALTLDTHHPDGYIPSSCKGLIYQDGKNPILNAVHCADQLAGKFIDKLKLSSAYANTTLVVTSDHLALKNSATSMLEMGDRKNLFLIFDQDINPKKISKPGTVFDIAPTVLSAMGSHTKGLGFGRNLFFESSLIESHLSMKSIVESYKKDILSLWSFPQINNNFEVDLKSKVINFGSRQIKLPTLILINDEFDIEEMRFDFYFSNPLINEVRSIKKSKNLIWIDQCEIILEFMKVDLALDEIQYCSYMFRKSDGNYLINDLQRETLDHNAIDLFFYNR